MQLRLWQRLFLAFAALSGLALAGFALWQQQSFRRGFLGYLDEVARQRLQPATLRLAAGYSETGSWDFLRDGQRRFADLVEPPPMRPPPPRDRPPPRPGRGELDVTDRRPPPPGDDRPPPDESPPPGHGGPSERPPPHGPPDLVPRLLLVDAAGVAVVGNMRVPRDAPEVAIMLDGERIGSLRLAPTPQLSSASDVTFAREQTRNVLIAGIAALVGALLLAFALARWLLAPIYKLMAGTRALSAGDYAQRVAVTRTDEFGILAHDFNQLAVTLEQHRESRRRWGADIAHELRTPLSILRGEIQALQDGVRAPTPQALDSLHAECERLGGLIEDLYQLSLADAGALDYHFEALDLRELVRDAMQLQHDACIAAGLVLEDALVAAPQVHGDPRRLAQLVDNLLVNARRYTDAPGRIRVALSASATGTQLVIEDTAPGVPPEALPRLFDRLYRVESSRSRAAGGAGLGLAICQAIVVAHEGSITAEPSALGGLRINVVLPMARQRA